MQRTTCQVDGCDHAAVSINPRLGIVACHCHDETLGPLAAFATDRLVEALAADIKAVDFVGSGLRNEVEAVLRAIPGGWL